MKLKFKAFKAVDDPLLCEAYIKGHVKVLEDYGITNVTSNTNEWKNMACVYGVVAEKEDGVIVGGIRVQMADGINMLPVEKAIGKIDPNIHSIVNNYISDGVGELCALWNAKEVAGLGISLLLTRAGISIVNQINCQTLMGICADYTLKMFSRVGFVVDSSLGDNGEFVYPNKNYIARVLGILNAENLSTAQEYDRMRMLDLRNNNIQTFVEKGANNLEIEIDYTLTL
jgi:hypothetical protein